MGEGWCICLSTLPFVGAVGGLGVSGVGRSASGVWAGVEGECVCGGGGDRVWGEVGGGVISTVGWGEGVGP